MDVEDLPPSSEPDRLRISIGVRNDGAAAEACRSAMRDRRLLSRHAADPATLPRMSRYNAIAASAVRLLRTPQGKRIGAQVVDGAARAADRVTGAKHSDRIERARDLAHRGLGRL